MDNTIESIKINSQMSNKKYLENHIIGLLKSAGADEVDVAQGVMAWDEWRKINPKPMGSPDEWMIDIQSIAYGQFQYTLTSLYESVLCYLDENKYSHFTQHFLKTFGEPFNAKDAVEKTILIEDYPISTRYNLFLHTLRRFLRVFEFVEGADFTKHIRSSKTLVLEAMLNNTAQIIFEMGLQPQSETDVYNAVKHVIKAGFPSSKDAGSNFNKTAKQYKPDILVPELEIAIEYKFADDINRLKAVVDEICADVVNYTGEPNYNEFYAVFYVTSDFWGEDRFKKVWEEKKFPKNWKGIYRVGNAQPKGSKNPPTAKK